MGSNQVDMWAVKEAYNNSDDYYEDQARRFNESEGRLDSVARQVLYAYNVPIGDYGGGKLAGIDIKHMDAFSAIRMSLFESAAGLAEGSFGSYFHLEELIMDNSGYAQFKAIGRYPGLNSCEFYFTTQAQNYLIHRTHTKVTGKKKRPDRTLGDWVNLISASNGGHLWDTSAMATSCYSSNIKRHATITFDDPHFDASSPVDGIESIYESKDIWEQVIGWVWFVDPGAVNEDTTIKFMETGVSVPIRVGGVGALVRRAFSGGSDASCFEGMGQTVGCGLGAVSVTIPSSMRYETVRGTKVDKFIKLVKVYVVAYHLSLCFGKPVDGASAISGGNQEVWVCIDEMVPSVYQMSEGIDYAFGVDVVMTKSTVKKNVCLQFANNAFYADGARYGGGVDFRVVDYCDAYNFGIADTNILQRDDRGKWSIGKGTVFPYDNLTGLLITEVWAQIELDTPGIVVEDPSGHALGIAAGMVVQVAPMKMYDEPAPIAIDGHIIDQSEAEKDSDPLTVQNFTETEYEKRLLEMDGGNTIELTMATLDERQCAQLSSELYRIANDYTGHETTYMCTPGSEPQLGGYGNSDGIVNSITYSYSDQSSYTITVTEGSHLVGGLTGVTGGPAVVATESVSATGHVIQDYGNGALYKVLLEGIGPRDCISAVSGFIRVGDTVNVTIYNNPVETLA